MWRTLKQPKPHQLSAYDDDDDDDDDECVTDRIQIHLYLLR